MKIVIVGSGLAGVTLAEELARQGGHEISLVTAERAGHYARPRLSHGFSCSDDAVGAFVIKRFDALAAGAAVMSGVQVSAVDRALQRLVLCNGETLDYDVLVLATGSAARIPAHLLGCRAAFHTLNSLEDLYAIRARRLAIRADGKTPHWAIIGGGLIGCEAASDLRKAVDRVTIFQVGERLLPAQLDEAGSRALHEHFAASEVELMLGCDVRALKSSQGEVVVHTSREEVGRFDAAIVATGFAPRVDLAAGAGLDTGRGILANEYLRTADPSIYALGDVAQIAGRIHAYVSPIRSQALWLAQHLNRATDSPWTAPAFRPIIKIHGFKLPKPVEAHRQG